MHQISYDLLNRILGPQDIKSLTIEELTQLAEEVRHRIIDVVSHSGGHLASSLGVVELTIALHFVYDAPKDKIIWDVGHQCYANKILTGRNQRFDTLRKEGGLAGFPAREESEYDPFTTGHAGTSISSALGFAQARDLKGEDHRVLAVIGDGSMTAGLAFEGLNHAGSLKTNLTVILNDNKMSISSNVGALSQHLNRLITGKWYRRVKEQFTQVLHTVAGDQVAHFAKKFEEGMKGAIVPGGCIRRPWIQICRPHRRARAFLFDRDLWGGEEIEGAKACPRCDHQRERLRPGGGKSSFVPWGLAISYSYWRQQKEKRESQLYRDFF